MSSARLTPTPVRRLPLADVLRLNRPSDIWFKPALSVVVAVGVPNLALLALGRLAERAGHRTLAATVRGQGPHLLEDVQA